MCVCVCLCVWSLQGVCVWLVAVRVTMAARGAQHTQHACGTRRCTHLADVKAAREHVRGDEDLCLAAPELPDDAVAVLKRHVTLSRCEDGCHRHWGHACALCV
jgi:hypothetical protein